MRIIDVQIGKITIPLKKPFRTALRTAQFIEDFVIKILTDNGLTGYGSCPKTLSITGEGEGSLFDVLRLMKDRLLRCELHSVATLMNKITIGITKNYSAKACFDMALHDLYCQQINTPLYQYLGGDKCLVFTSLTVSSGDIHLMIADAKQAVRDGFCELKIKVGVDPENDAQRIIAIANEIGPKIKLRVDANQGWKTKEAIRIIRKLEKQNVSLEFIEQPVPAEDIEGLAYIHKRVDTSILADESLFTPHDALILYEKKAADIFNIKLAKAGGILQAEKIYHIAEAAHVECLVGSMLESHIAISAAAHFAAAKKNITRCDLDGSFLASEQPIESSVTLDGNILIIDEHAPGLGIKHIEGWQLL